MGCVTASPRPAAELLAYLYANGFQVLAPEPDRLRIIPAGRLSDDLKSEITARKQELLSILLAPTDFVTLRDNLIVALPAMLLALDLERRGFRQMVSADGDYAVEAANALTAADRAGIARWRWHLKAIIGYSLPAVS
jgi:hypothetical protein